MDEWVTIGEVGPQDGLQMADLMRLIAARAFLEQGLPDETRYGGVARAGLPRTFRPWLRAR